MDINKIKTMLASIDTQQIKATVLDKTAAFYEAVKADKKKQYALGALAVVALFVMTSGEDTSIQDTKTAVAQEQQAQQDQSQQEQAAQEQTPEQQEQAQALSEQQIAEQQEKERIAALRAQDTHGNLATVYEKVYDYKTMMLKNVVMNPIKITENDSFAFDSLTKRGISTIDSSIALIPVAEFVVRFIVTEGGYLRLSTKGANRTFATDTAIEKTVLVNGDEIKEIERTEYAGTDKVFYKVKKDDIVTLLVREASFGDLNPIIEAEDGREGRFYKDDNALIGENRDSVIDADYDKSKFFPAVKVFGEMKGKNFDINNGFKYKGQTAQIKDNSLYSSYEKMGINNTKVDKTADQGNYIMYEFALPIKKPSMLIVKTDAGYGWYRIGLLSENKFADLVPENNKELQGKRNANVAITFDQAGIYPIRLALPQLVMGFDRVSKSGYVNANIRLYIKGLGKNDAIQPLDLSQVIMRSDERMDSKIIEKEEAEMSKIDKL